MHARATRNLVILTPLYVTVTCSTSFAVAMTKVNAQSRMCERTSKKIMRSSEQEAARYLRAAVDVAESVGSSRSSTRSVVRTKARVGIWMHLADTNPNQVSKEVEVSCWM